MVQLPFASNSSIELSKYAQLGLSKIFKKGYAYKKAGVIAMDFTPESVNQLNLFENKNPKHIEIMKSLDSINKRTGRDIVKLGSQDQKKTWKMRQERLSNRYTTRFDEIVEIKL